MSYYFHHWEIDNIFDEKKFKKSKNIKNKKQKKVRYSNTVTIILIPTKEEYIEAGIDLWDKI